MLRIDVWELIRLANRHPRVDILPRARALAATASLSIPGSWSTRPRRAARLIRTAREVNDSARPRSSSG